MDFFVERLPTGYSGYRGPAARAAVDGISGETFQSVKSIGRGFGSG